SYAEISAMVYNVFIDQTISALADEQSGVPALANGAAALNDGIASFVSNYQEFDLGLATATEGAQKLHDASTDLISGSQELAQGSTTLAEGCGDLADGSAALDDGALQLQEGVAKLQDGTEELHQGMVTFDEEGIQELTERVNDGCGDLDEFTDRLDGVLEAGRSYQSYSGLANGASGDVKFIYKTGAVK
nr:hypothetical protein [Lachnospiraceae bacterium]